jgi:hypothetical protein
MEKEQDPKELQWELVPWKIEVFGPTEINWPLLWLIFGIRKCDVT